METDTTLPVIEIRLGDVAGIEPDASCLPPIVNDDARESCLKKISLAAKSDLLI